MHLVQPNLQLADCLAAVKATTAHQRSHGWMTMTAQKAKPGQQEALKQRLTVDHGRKPVRQH